MMLFIVALHLFFLIFLYFGLGTVVKNGYRSQFIDYVRADAFNFAANLNGSHTLKDNINTQALEEAVLSGRTLYVNIFDTQQQLIASAGIKAPSPFIEDFRFGEGKDDIYHIVATVYSGTGLELGVIHIGYDESGAQDHITIAYQRASILSAIYVAIALIVSIYLGHKMTHPIKTLRELTRKIAHGHYQTEVAVSTRVLEISSLADTIEFMREELVAQSNSMEHLALHDHLTGLPNRVLLEDRVKQAVSERQQDNTPGVLAVIDLDRFKEINDSFGHLMGDNILKKVANRLLKILRQSDTIARLGGDEFAILLPNTALDPAMRITDKIMAELTRPFDCEGHNISIGASIGIACYPDHGTSYLTLLNCSDVAMYAAKKSGGGVQVYTSSLDQDSLAHLTLVSDLRVAIDQHQFFAVYQPKINLADMTVAGVEVLIRWHHPSRGIVPPLTFIPLAERSGLITKITHLILQDAVNQSLIWQSQDLHIPVAVNLSPIDFEGDELQESIFSIIKDSKFSPSLLELEVTESGFFADPIRATEILDKLADAGVSISIDDFGTGYSSLAQLRKMPVSTLKIDCSFVFGMLENNNDAAIVSATISMAHQMGLKVVAEGVENIETLRALRALNCDVAQGYYFAKPMVASEFEKWLKHYNKPIVEARA